MTSQLLRSFAAKIIGSSCIWPRCAISHVRLTQYNSNGHATQIICGCRYRLVVLPSWIYSASTSTDSAVVAALAVANAVGDVVDGIRNRSPRTNVVVTGRDAPAELVEVADTVTEMRKVKHAYDEGIKAVKGIEY